MIGCAVRGVLVGGCLAAAAWFTRGTWWPLVARPAVAPAAAWVPVGDSAAGRAERAARALSRRGGPAFVAVDGEDAAALALRTMRSRLPSGVRDVAVRVAGDTVALRAVVRPAEFGGRKVLGPVYDLLPARDTIRLDGTLEGLGPGVGQFRVRAIRFRDLPLPPRAIEPLLRQLAGPSRPAGLAGDAFPVPLPTAVGDVRVRDGRVVLYRATP